MHMYFSSYGSLPPQANGYFLACTIVPEDVSDCMLSHIYVHVYCVFLYISVWCITKYQISGMRIYVMCDNFN